MFRFTFYTNNVKKITKAQIMALEATGLKMKQEKTDSQEIPFDTGFLQNVSTVIDAKELKNGNLKISHKAPYARRIYFWPSSVFHKTFNVNAKGQWWEDWLSGKNKNRAKQIYANYLRRFSQGTIQ